jgi:hypothetical protein
MTQQIFYIICHPERKFYFFDRHNDAERKQNELAEKYGYLKPFKTGISDHLDDLMSKIPKYQIQYKSLKTYYGTVWYAYKWNNDDTCSYVIQGRWKDIKHNKENGYTIKKVVLTPYKEYMKRYEEDDSDTSYMPETGLF